MSCLWLAFVLLALQRICVHSPGYLRYGLDWSAKQ